MRWSLVAISFIVLLLFSGFIYVRSYPFKLYSSWIQGKEWSKYYTIENYKASYLGPMEIEPIPPYKEDYSQLWKNFPLRNSNIPLPVRHPLFQTVPIIESTNNKSLPQLGIIILSPNDRELSRVYTLPPRFNEDNSQGQVFLKLPVVRNKILKIPPEKLWKDVFTHKIEVKRKSLDEMIHDLYIMHLRSKMLPPSTVKYNMINEDQALVELASKDKDYIIELVMTYKSGTIYSFVLKTEKNNDESQKLRSKFLENISFSPVDLAMKKILYTEFKQLNFARQVDQEGMLYLFSAWSQELGDMQLLKEMIFYLERGRSNGKQLRPLYTFAMNHYGKTFTSKKLFDDHDDPNLLLQRKIEIENIEIAQAAEKMKSKPPVEPELTPDERMNLYLKKAKEEGPPVKDDMTIH